MQYEILAYGPAPKYYSMQYEPLKQDICESCSNKRIGVLSPVIRTPHDNGNLNSMFRAKAVPITTKNKQSP
jgi:hypothetical protein